MAAACAAVAFVATEPTASWVAGHQVAEPREEADLVMVAGAVTARGWGKVMLGAAVAGVAPAEKAEAETVMAETATVAVVGGEATATAAEVVRAAEVVGAAGEKMANVEDGAATVEVALAGARQEILTVEMAPVAVETAVEGE